MIVPCEDWATVLRTTQVDYTGEIKLLEPTTWAQVAPALPAADLTARVRAIDLAEGPMREFLRDPTKVLLPSTEWPQPVPQAKVSVASDDDWAEICKGCADAMERQCSMVCSEYQRMASWLRAPTFQF